MNSKVEQQPSANFGDIAKLVLAIALIIAGIVGYYRFEHQVRRSLIERVARAGMQEKFSEVLVPTEEVIEMRGGQKRKSERKFFPGYVLVQIESQGDGKTLRIDDECWHLVKETPKVMG